MNEDQRNPDLSRRDFVRTAAAGLGGISAAALGGASVPPAAAQTGDAPLPTGNKPRIGGLHDKLVITLSPSGRASKDLPTQGDMRDPKQHADAAVEGFNAGAGIVHLRGQNLPSDPYPQGGPRPSSRPDLKNWGELTTLVRSRCNIVVNFGSAGMNPANRKNLLTLKPEAGSVLVSHHYLGLNVPEENIRQSLIDHMEAGVLPEVEIFHTGELANLNRMVDAGLIKPPFCVTIFFNWNPYHGVQPSLTQLQARLELLPPNTHWTMCAKGVGHLEMSALAISLGGHVRTGLEMNVQLANGRMARTQGECVERMVQLARALGRDVATPAEARQQLGLPRKPEKPRVSS